MPMLKEQAFSKTLRIIEEFRKLDAEMPLQVLAVFITVARKEGITMRDIGNSVGISQASCSRNVAALSKWHRLGKQGHDLIVAIEDPAERRRKIVKLTAKGKRFADSLSHIFND